MFLDMLLLAVVGLISTVYFLRNETYVVVHVILLGTMGLSQQVMKEEILVWNFRLGNNKVDR